MSAVKLQGVGSGTGMYTFVPTATNSDRTITLPDASGTVLLSGGAISGTTGTFSDAVSGTTGSFTGNMSFNSGYGSAAVAYGCRAWVNFNGTGTVAIRGSGNITSITDNNTGDYTLNFTNTMPDANYSISGTASRAGTSGQPGAGVTVTPNDAATARTTGLCRVILMVNGGDGQYDTAVDSAQVNINILR